VLTLGAGDITGLGEDLLRRLEYEYQDQPAGGGASHSD